MSTLSAAAGSTVIQTIAGGSVTTPRGFRATGVSCGIKASGKPDLAMVLSDCSASSAGMFTTNRVRAACVDINRERVTSGSGRLIVVNSGNANCYTGRAGYSDALHMSKLAAEAVDVEEGETFTASTGHIGQRLPMDLIGSGIHKAVSALSPEGGAAAAEAIMTTDTVPKHCAVEADLADGPVRVGAIAKGSGMIHPNMATMLCFVTTDASVTAECLNRLLRSAVDCSFHHLSVDGDTSTNDMVIALANGASGIEPGAVDEDTLAEAFRVVCLEMAKAIARDGEGATKLLEVQVKGARTKEDALKAARAIANSPLVKTAIFGQDPNWGRILAAAGYSGACLEQEKLSLHISGHPVVLDGEPIAMDDERRQQLFKGREIAIVVDLAMGDAADTFWTCDLSYDYVKINAEYHT